MPQKRRTSELSHAIFKTSFAFAQGEPPHRPGLAWCFLHRLKNPHRFGVGESAGDFRNITILHVPIGAVSRFCCAETMVGVTSAAILRESARTASCNSFEEALTVRGSARMSKASTRGPDAWRRSSADAMAHAVKPQLARLKFTTEGT